MTHDEQEDLRDESPEDKSLNHVIDEMLINTRPERYAPDAEWFDPLVDEVVGELDSRPDRAKVLRTAARNLVGRREQEQCKRVHSVLRDIGKTGALPLGWGETDDWKSLLAPILNLPLRFPDTGTKVRLGAVSPSDLWQWIVEDSADDDADKIRRANTRYGARLLYDWMTAQNVNRSEDLTGTGIGRITKDEVVGE